MELAASWLDGVQVASPCQAAWSDMAGDEQVRFCSHCALHVYNLSAMTRAEAEACARERRPPVRSLLSSPGRDSAHRGLPARLAERATRAWGLLATLILGCFAVLLGAGQDWFSRPARLELIPNRRPLLPASIHMGQARIGEGTPALHRPTQHQTTRPAKASRR